MLTVFLFAKAYHVSNAKYTIATVDCGEDATIKVWSMQRSSSHPRISVRGTLGRWSAEVLTSISLVMDSVHERRGSLVF